LLSKEEESKQTRLEQETSKKKAMSVRNLATHRHDTPSSPSTLKNKAKSVRHLATHHHDTPSSSSLSEMESVKEGGEGGDDFPMACDLLRSTAPRQTLWVARVVSQRLERHVQQHQPKNYNNESEGGEKPASFREKKMDSQEPQDR
jgi:hypothetical protein